MGKGMRAGKKPKAQGMGNMQKQMQQMQAMQRKIDALQDEILKWFLDTYRADVIDQSVDNDQPEEALYFSRYEVMEKLLLHQYPSLSESFTDHMIELLYAELF